MNVVRSSPHSLHTISHLPLRFAYKRKPTKPPFHIPSTPSSTQEQWEISSTHASSNRQTSPLNPDKRNSDYKRSQEKLSLQSRNRQRSPSSLNMDMRNR